MHAAGVTRRRTCSAPRLGAPPPRRPEEPPEALPTECACACAPQTLIEIPEIIEQGVLKYVQDAWNIFDMLAYTMVFVGIAQIYQFLEEDQYVGQYFAESFHCSGLCETVRFEDDLP